MKKTFYNTIPILKPFLATNNFTTFFLLFYCSKKSVVTLLRTKAEDWVYFNMCGSRHAWCFLIPWRRQISSKSDKTKVVIPREITQQGSTCKEQVYNIHVSVFLNKGLCVVRHTFRIKRYSQSHFRPETCFIG